MGKANYQQPTGRGAGWVIAQVPLLAVSLATPLADHLIHPRSSSGNARAAVARAFGLAGMVTSAAMFWQAGHTLGPDLIPYPKPREGAILRHTGIYGHVRHPIYLGILVALFSWALFWRSRLGLAQVAPVCGFFVAKSRHEERFLLAEFPEYTAYQQRTPAFIPRWRAATDESER